MVSFYFPVDFELAKDFINYMYIYSFPAHQISYSCRMPFKTDHDSLTINKSESSMVNKYIEV